MKKLQTAGVVFVSCFAAVFGALTIDRIMDGKNATTMASPVYKVPLTPISYENGQAVPDFRVAAKKVTQSVVTVDQFRRGMRYFGDEEGQMMQAGTGSGVILYADGIIVTNNHVVAGAEQVKVRLPDHRVVEAKVVGRDDRSDIAVLKIEAKNLTPIEVGNSDRLEVGEWVMAVGNPLGVFENTVSVGVVSSLGRSLGVENSFMTDAIQTDAAINPGNSGGALTNGNGELVGINAAIAGRTNIGIGFAIPVNRVKTIVNDIRTIGHARYAGLGIKFDPRLTGALQTGSFRQEFESTYGRNAPQNGIIVGSVDANGAAGKLGLQRGDVLIAIDGRELNDPLVLNEVLNRKKPGDQVSLKYWTKGNTKTVNVVLGEIRPDLPLE